MMDSKIITKIYPNQENLDHELTSKFSNLPLGFLKKLVNISAEDRIIFTIEDITETQ